jgi:hypothetical protein
MDTAREQPQIGLSLWRTLQTLGVGRTSAFIDHGVTVANAQHRSV